MNRIKISFLILVFCILSACSPSPQAIQTAIAQTQSANPPVIFTPIPPTFKLTTIPTITFTPTHPIYTITPTYPTPTVFFIASATVLPTPVTYTFIIEDGWCLLQAGNIEPTIDPKTNTLCSLTERNQIKMILDSYIELTPWNNNGGVEPYCALFSLGGKFIVSDVDVTGSGKVQCGPPQGYQP